MPSSVKTLVRGLSWGALGVIMISSGAVACATLLGFEDLADGPDATTAFMNDGGEEEAGVDAGVDAAACVPVPPPPTPVAGGGSALRFALSALRITDQGASPRGLDLDCTVTDTADKSSCALDPDRSKFSAAVRDQGEATGIDNAGIAALSYLEGTARDVFPLSQIDQRVRAGDVGINFEVQDVVDLRDDDAVSVFAYPTEGLASASSPPCAERTHYDAGRPLRRDDVWCFDGRFLTATRTESTLRSDAAWIRDGQLIAHFPRVAIPVVGTETREVFYINLQNAWMTAKIASEGTGLSEGVLAGRWAIAEIGRQVVAAMQQGDASTCTTTEQGAGPFAALCPYRDILVDERSDPSRSCDSISVSALFEAYEVHDRGEEATIAAVEDRCADAGAHYDCPSAP